MFENATKTALILALGIGLAGRASAREQRVDRAEVPGAVVSAVLSKYPKGTLTRFTKEQEHGSTVYEVNVEIGTERREVEVSPDGKLLGEERTLAFEETPAAVQHAFAHSRYAKGKVVRAEESRRYVPTEKVTYELLVKVEGRKLELAYDYEGKLVEQEPGEED
jgi:hypothetical protein